MIVVGDMTDSEAATLLAVNNLAVPEVNDLTADEFAEVAAMGRVRVARRGDEALGFVVTMGPKEAYDSTNYQWFQARYDDFLYVDRIVVAETARGLGAGRALYEDTIALGRSLGRARVCSEVNTVPPNPGSMAFHAALGFVHLEERLNPGSGKRVMMMTRDLAG